MAASAYFKEVFVRLFPYYWNRVHLCTMLKCISILDTYIYSSCEHLYVLLQQEYFEFKILENCLLEIL